jgi:hypothetical protein
MAYFGNTPAMKKSFETLTAGVNIINLFFLGRRLKGKTNSVVCPWQAFPR